MQPATLTRNSQWGITAVVVRSSMRSVTLRAFSFSRTAGMSRFMLSIFTSDAAPYWLGHMEILKSSWPPSAKNSSGMVTPSPSPRAMARSLRMTSRPMARS